MREFAAIAIAIALLPAAGAGADGRGEHLIPALIADLDHEEFAVRQRAAAGLVEVGDAALPQLLAAAAGGPPEQRARAADLVRAIRQRAIVRGFEKLARAPGGEIDVERGMWLIASLLDPGLEEAEIGARLDAMAEAVREELGEGVDPKSLAGPEMMAALTGVLKDKFGLRGDVENYDHPDNSSIHRVLEQKDGLPILLSEIAVAVGRRLEVPVVGLPVPGRYMIKYDGSLAPPGAPKSDVIINPYEGWKVMTPAELGRAIGFFDPDLHLAPADPRATLERMLNNLESDSLAVGRPRDAAVARACRSALVATRPVE